MTLRIINKQSYQKHKTMKLTSENVADVLREKLHQGKVKFVFKKKDGTRRPAVGTLNFDIIPPADTEFKSDTQREERDDQVTYYDCEKMAWRCCKTENILEIDGKQII